MRNNNNGKLNAAEGALAYVKDGMTVGLGSGTTAELFIRLLAKKNLDVRCVPTSIKTANVAKRCGLKMVKFSPKLKIDLAVDGADGVDGSLNLIKGYGGAMLMEKIVDYAARRFIVIVDGSKVRKRLDGRVPLEVERNLSSSVISELDLMGIESETRRKGDRNWITDNGNSIVDAYFAEVKNPRELDAKLKRIDGVIETGLFTGAVWKVIVGSGKGARILKR